MFFQPWHDLYEITGAVAVIELIVQNFVPTIFASSW